MKEPIRNCERSVEGGGSLDWNAVSTRHMSILWGREKGVHTNCHTVGLRSECAV